MKFNFLTTIIAILAACLAAFGLYEWCHMANAKMLVACLGGISLCATLVTTLGISLTRTRTSINMKVLSGIFAILFLISNCIFCSLHSFSIAQYIIPNGLLLLIWILVTYSISKTSINKDK